MANGYYDIACFDFEESDEMLSGLPIGATLNILSLPDIDDEVWTEAYVSRESETLWILTDITRKFMDNTVVSEQVWNHINLEMNTSEDYEVEVDDSKFRILIRTDCTYKAVNDLWSRVRVDFFDYYSAYMSRKLVAKNKQKIQSMLPVYERAKNVILLELNSFSKEVDCNQCKIVDINGRTKDIDSIEEKVYRKVILSSQVLEKFDDIAGVRVVCEYISDVYFLLEYIKDNPLIKVVEIDDKIDNPTIEGYRGIHVIVEVEVFYNNLLYENVKVEIQLRSSFQNGWAMKTHNLTYKRENVLSKEIANQMKLLSDSLFEADKKAQELRDFLIEKQ